MNLINPSELVKGELLLYSSRKSTFSSLLSLGIISRIERRPYRNPRLMFTQRQRLLTPDRVIYEGRERGIMKYASNEGINVDMIKNFWQGKSQILDYLDTRPDMRLHREWISKLESPYKLPEFKVLIII